MGFFQTLANGYKIMAQETKSYCQKHRSGIGTAVSIGGTIASNILSTKAGAKSAREIDAKEIELGRVMTTGEKVKLCWTNHVAPVATAAVSCVGAGYSHNEHVKDFNKVATAYAGVKKLYDESKKATREVLGEKKAAELQDKVNQKYMEEHPEVAKKITGYSCNPDPSTMQKYYEPMSGIVLYSNRDKVDKAILTIAAEMKALKPRTSGCGLYNEGHGIKLRRFFEVLDSDISEEKLKSNVMNFGWNKGACADGSDDDQIAAYYTPMLINDDREAVIVINWEQDPSDMRYGDYLKL